MKVMLMKWRTNNIKRCTAFLLVLFMMGIQVIDLPQVVFADGISGNRWVSYRVDQVYDKDDKSLTITVDADEERSDVTIESMILPDGTVVYGNQAVYKVYSNGNYKFSVEYTVDAATATSSTAAGSTTAGSTIAGSTTAGSTVEAATATSATASPSEAAGKRKKRDIDVVVNAFPAVFAAGDVTINDTANFPDPEFQKYLRDNCDPNNDGILSRDEQLLVKSIKIQSTELTDMAGLHFFANLEALDINNDNTTKEEFKLDIRGNPELTFLKIYGGGLSRLDIHPGSNVKLQQIILDSVGRLSSLDTGGALDLFWNLDLRNCSQLSSLNTHGSRGISNVWIENCPLSSLKFMNMNSLSSLNLWNMRLSDLDLSTAGKLLVLGLYNVEVPSIDFGDIDNMNHLVIDDVRCNNTNLDTSKLIHLKYFGVNRRNGNTPDSVDVSHNLKLVSLSLNNFPMDSVDVSKNLYLRNLTVVKSRLTNMDVSKNPYLQRLYLNENQLASVDVSKNPWLNVLDLRGNQLTNVDLSNNRQLWELYISNNNISTLDLGSNWSLRSVSQIDNQVVEGFYQEQDANYIINFNEVVGSHNLGRIASVSQNGSTIPYDPATGIAMAPISPDKNITYAYHTRGGAMFSLMNVGMSLRGRYLINAAAGVGGSITPPGDTVVAEGGTQEYRITPDAGYELDVLSVDGVTVGNTDRYTFRDVRADHRIEAVFQVMTAPAPVAEYRITAASGAGGSITPPGETVVAEGGTQEYRITPDAGYELDVLSVDGVTIGNTDRYTFRDVRADHRIEAVFQVMTAPAPVAEYRITAASGAGGSITPPGDTVVAEGGTQEYRITPDAGYELDVLSVDGVTIGNTDRYTFRDVRADHRIEAVFQVMTAPAPAAEYKITAAAGAGGRITPPGETVVAEGSTQEYRITPDAGYELDVLSVDGVTIGNTDRYVFLDVRADHKIEAAFKRKQPPVTNGSHGGGGGNHDSHVNQPSTNSQVTPNVLVKPISLFWETIWSEEEPAQKIPGEPAWTEPEPIETTPIETTPTREVEVAREVKVAKLAEEVRSVKPMEQPLKKPEAEMVKGELGEKVKEGYHLPLAMVFLLICVAGAILIKRERDIISQMAAEASSAGTTSP